MNHSNTLPDVQKHNTSPSTEELKNQKDDSSDSRASHRLDREPSAVARLNPSGLQKSTMEQDAQERGEGVQNERSRLKIDHTCASEKCFFLILSRKQDGTFRHEAQEAERPCSLTRERNTSLTCSDTGTDLTSWTRWMD